MPVKKNLKKLLHDLDEETAVQIAEEFPSVSDSDKERLFRQIERRVRHTEEVETPHQVSYIVHEMPRLSWVRSAVSAAACLLVCCGTVAGLLRLQQSVIPPVPETNSAAQFSTNCIPVKHETGERYIVSNLTRSGILWLTVNGAEMHSENDETIITVTITLESDDAVSIAGTNVFLADNFLLGTDHADGQWKVTQPCGFSAAKEVDSHSFSFILEAGESRTLTLDYKTDVKQPLCFTTSCSNVYAYTQLNLQED